MSWGDVLLVAVGAVVGSLVTILGLFAVVALAMPATKLPKQSRRWRPDTLTELIVVTLLGFAIVWSLEKLLG
jgi:ABC-type Mn2+/Zn2+ transport system permease subunit